VTSFFTGKYSYSKQCVGDTNRPNRPGILSTRVNEFVTILFYTDASYIRSWYAGYEFEGIKIWGWFTENNECESLETKATIRSIPRAILDPGLFQYTIPSLRVLLRATPLLCSKYTTALSLGSTSNLLRDIYASQNVLPQSRVNRYSFYDRNLFDFVRTCTNVNSKLKFRLCAIEENRLLRCSKTEYYYK